MILFAFLLENERIDGKIEASMPLSNKKIKAKSDEMKNTKKILK